MPGKYCRNVDGSCIGDRAVRSDELHRHCEEVHDEEEETAEKQKEQLWTEGHKHFTEVGRIAEITT